MMKSEISVAMATFNGEKNIFEQLEGLAGQTMASGKLVVNDDSSSDATLRLIEDCSSSKPFPIQIIRNEARLGYGRNFLKAALLSRGEYIAFCDQDDVWRNDNIESIQRVTSLSRMDLIVHGGRVVDQTLTDLGASFPIVPDGAIVLKDFENFFVPGYAMVVKKDRLIQGGYLLWD